MTTINRKIFNKFSSFDEVEEYCNEYLKNFHLIVNDSKIKLDRIGLVSKMEKQQKDDHSTYKRVFDYFEVRGLRNKIGIKYYDKNEFDAYNKGLNDESTKYFIPPFRLTKDTFDFWGERVVHECFVCYSFKPVTSLYHMLDMCKDKKIDKPLSLRAMYDYLSELDFDPFQVMTKGFKKDKNGLPCLKESCAMIRILVMLNLALIEIQYPKLKDMIIEYLAYLMLDHPAVQIRKISDLISMIPSIMFCKSKPFKIPNFKGDQVVDDISWTDNYFTVKKLKMLDEVLSGLREKGLNKMAKLIDESQQFSDESFLNMQIVFGLQYVNGYCSGDTYKATLRQVYTGAGEVIEDYGIDETKAKQAAELSWDNIYLKSLDDYEEMKKYYFDNREYLKDYIGDSKFGTEGSKNYSIEKEFERRIDEVFNEVIDQVDTSKIMDYYRLMKDYYTFQTPRSAGGIRVTINGDKPIRLTTKYQVAPFFVDAIADLKVLKSQYPMTTGKREVPGGKFPRTIFNVVLPDYVYSCPLFRLLLNGKRKMDQFKDTTGDYFNDHGILFTCTTNPGYLIISIDVSNWDSRLTMDKRRAFVRAISKRLNISFYESDSIRMSFGELYELLEKKNIRAPLIVYDYQASKLRIIFSSHMKSGEYNTANENSITNLANIRVCHSIVSNNMVTNLINYNNDKATGDDGMAVYKIQSFIETRNSDGSRFIEYSKDVIRDIDMVERSFNEGYTKLKFKPSMSKGGYDNSVANYLKKTIIFGYIFYNMRVQFFSTELVLYVTRVEMLSSIISKARLIVERGGVLDVMYDLMFRLIITSYPIKTTTPHRIEGSQNFIIPLYSMSFLSIEDGGIGLPIFASQLIVPNGTILPNLLYNDRSVLGYKISDVRQIYRLWYQETLNSNDETDSIIKRILSKDMKFNSVGNYDLKPNLNLKAFYATLNQSLIEKSKEADHRLRQYGQSLSSMILYHKKLYKYFSVGLKNSNLSSTNYRIKESYNRKTFAILGKMKRKSPETLLDKVIKYMTFELIDDIDSSNPIANVAIGANPLFQNLIKKFGYAVKNKINPLRLTALQDILNKDFFGPKDVKVESMLKLFLDPFYLFKIDNFRLLLEGIGFSASLAEELRGELLDKAIYYYLVDAASYSYTSETILLSDLSPGSLNRFIDVTDIAYQVLVPFAYGIGLFILIDNCYNNSSYKIKVKINFEKISDIMSSFGFGI